MSYEQMRRKDRLLTEEEARAILADGEYGILSTVSGEGQPYGTPLSYAVVDGAICFHCARDGHKLRNLAAEPRVCFTVVGGTRPVFDKGFTTYYESAVVFGAASPVEGEEEKIAILGALCEKYLPAHMDMFQAEINSSLRATAVWKVSIDHLTGKSKR